MSGFENIEQISNWISYRTTDGYYTININDLSFKNYKVTISNIVTNKLNENFKSNSIGEEEFRLWWKQYRFHTRFPNIRSIWTLNISICWKGFKTTGGWSTKTAVSFKTCLLASMCLKLGPNLQILYRVIPRLFFHGPPCIYILYLIINCVCTNHW
jgi:hypothetical protein